MSTVVWAYKLQNSKFSVAGFLLQFLGILMYQAECSSMIPHQISGEDNIMADIISRAFKTWKYFNASNDLVSYFYFNFPLLQNESWHECQVPSTPLSCVIFCLSGKLLSMASLLRQTQIGKNIGSTGKTMRPQQKSTLSSTNPYLPSNVTSFAGAFADRVRTGRYGRENQIKVSGFSDALVAISNTIEMDGKSS